MKKLDEKVWFWFKISVFAALVYHAKTTTALLDARLIECLS